MLPWLQHKVVSTVVPFLSRHVQPLTHQTIMTFISLLPPSPHFPPPLTPHSPLPSLPSSHLLSLPLPLSSPHSSSPLPSLLLLRSVHSCATVHPTSITGRSCCHGNHTVSIITHLLLLVQYMFMYCHMSSVCILLPLLLHQWQQDSMRHQRDCLQRAHQNCTTCRQNKLKL